MSSPTFGFFIIFRHLAPVDSRRSQDMAKAILYHFEAGAIGVGTREKNTDTRTGTDKHGLTRTYWGVADPICQTLDPTF